MKVTRGPALLVFAVLIFGGIISSTSQDLEQEAAGIGRVISSAVGLESDLVSIWYCISGTVGGAGIADHEVILGNKSDKIAEVALTVTPVLAPQRNSSGDGQDRKKAAPEVIQIERIQTSIEIPPRSVETVVVVDLPQVAGEFASVMLESNVGDLIVEHRVVGDTGESQSNCQSDASTEWYFASGTTRDEAREIISVFNPLMVLECTFIS